MSRPPDPRAESLPRPGRTRWQPLRSGLVNLYRFDREEFHYEDGRLLLRGNNGTGKSRVLALQLPFLLDGDVSPYRLEPDGDPAKRIEWNLLMGRFGDRLGYTWIELGRHDEETGEDRFLTLGCGLSAVEGRGLVGKWFFVTERRIGVDFFLESASGAALDRRQLEDALDGDGQVFKAAADYRRAIDRRLFGLGERRYEALVRLLIQLRQPQLARKLDEEILSRALSDALPPLSETILADVAEAFASLETEREALDDLRAATHGADAFLGVYRRYARVLARRRADAVRSSHSDYEHSMRRLRAAEATLDDASRRGRALDERSRQLQGEHERLDAEVRTLEASPDMRDQHALDAAARRAETAREDFDRAAERLDAGREEHAEGERLADASRREAANRRDAARRALDEARGAAREAVLERAGLAAWTRLDGVLDVAEASDPETLARTSDEALTELGDAVERRRHAIRHVRTLAEAIARHEAALGHAREEQTRATDEVDDRLDAQRRAVDRRDAVIDELLTAWDAWRDTASTLSVAEAASLEPSLREWGQEPAGPSPLRAAVETAAGAARERLADEQARVDARIDAARAEQASLEADAAALEAGAEIRPPDASTRDEAARRARREAGEGAPLWALCEYADDVAPATRAAVEAALEASGLLDAWVTPDGELLTRSDDIAEHDTVLVAASADAPPAAGLDQVLRPDAGALAAAGVPNRVVEGLLRRIGWGDGEGRAWVTADGRFRVGPLFGSWAKDAPQYVGEAARRAERRRRLEALAEQMRVVATTLDSLRGERVALEQRLDTLRRDVLAAPSGDDVRDAAAEVAAAGAEVRRARERLQAAEIRVRQRRETLDAAIAERDADARDLGLADHLDQLDVLGRAVGTLDRRLAALGPVLELHRAAARDWSLRLAEVEHRAEQVARLRAERDAAESRANRADAEHATLRETLGETLDRLQQRLDAARAARERRHAEIAAAREERTALHIEEAKAEERIDAERAALGGYEATREAAIAGLRALAGLGLVSLAVPAADAEDPDAWSVSRAVELARFLEVELQEIDADQTAWDRLQSRVHERFRAFGDALLPHGYEPSLTTPADTIVVEVPFQGRPRPVDGFRDALVEETTTRERLLAAREREILENHLLSEISLHLHDRLRDAEELVHEINAELADRPMSSGMRLRFGWKARTEEIEHLAPARRLLLTDHRARSPEENRDVGRFLQGLIEAERESEEGGTWGDHLARALDYRAWHRFTIEQQDGRDGPWRRLTRRTHGTGSGGEKAIALTVPQFAAAAAHYRTASEHAPRLILLDEAFVGVDADMRAKCTSLLVAFDLDFVMTSEREWGCYPALPGLAIYQLATHPGIDAVGVSRWLWNGSEKVAAAIPQPARPSDDEPSDAAQSSLFGEPGE